MKIICPNCNEIDTYYIKEGLYHIKTFDVFGNKLKTTKGVVFNQSKKRCPKCNARVKIIE